jgi:hypothetical protein
MFKASHTLLGLAVVQHSMRNRNPEEELQRLGFGEVIMHDSFRAKMAGNEWSSDNTLHYNHRLKM